MASASSPFFVVEINGARLLSDLQTLRSFGATGTGVVRPTFSAADMASRRWLRDRMEDAGLDSFIDGVGNVIGRSRNPGPALIIGSHSDTQPEGGWLDGAMGVIYAIEIARTLAENAATSQLAVDAVAWSDEEATYTSCLGSNSFVDTLTKGDLANTNDAGESVGEAVARVGLASTPRARLEPLRHIGYLEAHIEQGPHLHESGHRIGIVTEIVGIRGFHVSFVGEQNHAGTTPMARRKDAGVAMFEFGVVVQKRLSAAAGPASVWTIGDARLEPGAESIIPGFAELKLQFRDPSDSTLDTMAAAVVELALELDARGPVQVTATPSRELIAPTVMDDDLRRHLCLVAQGRVPGSWVEMPSAAGHDPMVLSEHIRCAMLFIPSIAGISHDFAEDSNHDDIVMGCRVLGDAAVSILSEHS